MLYGLDLFSGIGCLSEALKPWVQVSAYCEIDRDARQVLLARMQSGDIDYAPIWDDVRTLTGEHIGRPDIILGGFPCQDLSFAGNGAGLAGKRSGLFYEITRLAQETQPAFIFLENVGAIRTRGLDVAIEELARIGYECRWVTLSAQAVGAPHKRERWFCLAYANGQRELQQKGPIESFGRRADNGYPQAWLSATDEGISLLVNGTPASMVDQKLIGNAVVVEQARVAFKYLAGLE